MTPISARSRRPMRRAVNGRAVLIGFLIGMLSSSARASSAVRTGRLAFLHDVFRAAHGMGRVHVDDVAGHQPVEEHAERGQVLLDRRRRELALQILDEGGDVERLHVGEFVDALLRAPSGEAARGVHIGLAGMVVVDLGGEEFEDALCRLRRGREERRRPEIGRRREDDIGMVISRIF